MPDIPTIADCLATDPRVARVACPGLPDDLQHERAATQLGGGFGGVVSFAIASTHEGRVRFGNDLRVITSAVSLGHDETLIAYEEYPEARAAAFDAPFREHGLIPAGRRPGVRRRPHRRPRRRPHHRPRRRWMTKHVPPP